MRYVDHANRGDHRSFSDDPFNTGESRSARGGEKSALASLYAKGGWKDLQVNFYPNLWEETFMKNHEKLLGEIFELALQHDMNYFG